VATKNALHSFEATKIENIADRSTIAVVIGLSTANPSWVNHKKFLKQHLSQVSCMLNSYNYAGFVLHRMTRMKILYVFYRDEKLPSNFISVFLLRF